MPALAAIRCNPDLERKYKTLVAKGQAAPARRSSPAVPFTPPRALPVL